MPDERTSPPPSARTTWILDTLHVTHPGLSEASSGALCASARVCMQRHHTSPTQFDVQVDEVPHTAHLVWREPTPRERNANANRLDATRDGAYAIALLSVERTLSLVAVGRAEHGTGADWYVAPEGKGLDESGTPNLDDPSVVRLEVGGHDDASSLVYELKVKVRQLQDGDSRMRGMAAVVAFKRARVLIQSSIAPRA